MSDERKKIKAEIEEAYNTGMAEADRIRILNEEAFDLDRDGKITGHIYFLQVLNRKARFNDGKLIEVIAMALLRRGVPIYKHEGYGYMLKDTASGSIHNLYRCYPAIFDSAPEIAGIFADREHIGGMLTENSDERITFTCKRYSSFAKEETVEYVFDRIKS